MNKEVFIHIGLPKTASTFIRDCVFSKHKDINYLSSNKFKYGESQIIKGIVDPNNTSFNSHIEKALIENSGKKVCISNGGFSGNLYNGEGSFLRLQQIKKILPYAKLIIVLREQYDYIYSVWSHSVLMGQSASLKNFLTYRDTSSVYEPFIWDRIDYANTVQICQNLFGKENVKIMFFEKLKKSKEDFLKELFDFIDIEYQDIESKEKNKGLQGINLHILRFINEFSKSKGNNGFFQFIPEGFRILAKGYLINNPVFRVDKKEQVKKLAPAYLKGEIVTSNRKLQQLISTDLKSMGYSV